jgi:hypothetical protein
MLNMLDHRTFKGNLYELIVFRNNQQREALMGAISCIEALSGGMPGIVISSTLQLKRELEVALANEPSASWINAVGLTVSASVDSHSSESYGDYMLSVVSVESNPYFKCIVTGPKGVVEWWPGCGRSETETMVSVGAWRHTIRRFFGLEAKGIS